MVTADHAGYVKYWQSNMNNVKMFQGHKEAVRGIRYCSLAARLCYLLIVLYLLLEMNEKRNCVCQFEIRTLNMGRFLVPYIYIELSAPFLQFSSFEFLGHTLSCTFSL